MFSSSSLEPSNKERWPEDSAGHEMTDQVPVVSPDYTLADTSSFLSHHIKDLEFISYIYVVNDDKKLAGVFSTGTFTSILGKQKLKKFVKDRRLLPSPPLAIEKRQLTQPSKTILKRSR